MPRLSIAFVVGLVLIAPAIAQEPVATAPAGAMTTLHQGFESDRPTWRQEESDASVDLKAHDRSDRAIHDGRRSERFEFLAGPGTGLYYSFAVPKIPLSPDLRAVLYVKGNHAGLQLAARVVLPADIDPETKEPSFVTVPGGTYDLVDRWQQLEITDVIASVERQARVLRAGSDGKRAVSLKGAYVESLILNLYGGPGPSEVFVDDLTISPVPLGAEANEKPAWKKPKGKNKGVQLSGDRLTLDGNDWVPAIIRAPGVDPAILKERGFDVYSVDLDADPHRVQEAVKLGMHLMPHLNTPPGSAPKGTEALLTTIDTYPFRDDVAFWYIGDSLGAEPDYKRRKAELDEVRELTTELHNRPSGSNVLTTGTVAGWFPQYAAPGQNLDLIGVHPAPFGTVLEPMATLRYLEQRRNLVRLNNPNAFFWAWIQTRPPASIRRNIWGDDTPPDWGIPRVQPEQVRLWSYTALSAGYRGLGYLGDADLTRTPSGRGLLDEMALLRAEVEIVESIIARGYDPISVMYVYPPDQEPVIIFNPLGNQGGLGSVGSRTKQQLQPPETGPNATIRAAGIATADTRGKLLLVTDYSWGAQWQPMQMALNNLTLRVPGPDTSQGFEITPAGVTPLVRERTTGGLKFTVKEFNIATMVLVTTDLELVERIKTSVARIAPMAATLALSEARIYYTETHEITRRLADDGHTIKESFEQLSKAQELLESAKDYQERGEYALAYSTARYAQRYARFLRRMHFEKAVKELGKVAKTEAQIKEEQAEERRVAFNKIATNRDKQIPLPEGFGVIKWLETPVASPPLVSFQTLPQHYIWMDWVRNAHFGENLLENGEFEDDEVNKIPDGWTDLGYKTDGIASAATVCDLVDEDEKAAKGEEKAEKKAKAALEEWKRKNPAAAKKAAAAAPKAKAEGPKKRRPPTWDPSSRQALRLGVVPHPETKIDDLPPFLDHPVAEAMSPVVKVKAKELIRIRAMIKVRLPTPQGVGGLTVRDSIGGEALQFRWTDGIGEWRELVLYRLAPADMDLTVSFGLAGFGTAEIDHVRIDRAEMEGTTPSPSPPPEPSPGGVARRTSPMLPDPSTPRAGALPPRRTVR